MSFDPSTWWHSIDILSRLNTWLQIATVVFYVLAAAFTAGTIVVSNRISGLQRDQAEELRRRVGRAEVLQAPRSLTVEQKRVLIDMLAPAKGAMYDIKSVINDSDGYYFALQLIDALKAAGWRGRIVPDVSMVTRPAHGVGIVVRNPQKLTPMVAMMFDALRAAGVEDLGLYIDNNAREDLVEIRVGIKRVPTEPGSATQ